MERLQAEEIVNLIEAAMELDSPLTITKMDLVDGMVVGFHQFIDSRDTVGAFEIETSDKQKYYLFFVPWYLDERYSLVLHARGVKEAIIGATDVRDKIIHWRYKPAKQDGRNEERRNKFTEKYLSIKAEVRVPQVAAEVEGFLNELLKIAWARIHAEKAVSTSNEKRERQPC